MKNCVFPPWKIQLDQVIFTAIIEELFESNFVVNYSMWKDYVSNYFTTEGGSDVSKLLLKTSKQSLMISFPGKFALATQQRQEKL